MSDDPVVAAKKRIRFLKNLKHFSNIWGEFEELTKERDKEIDKEINKLNELINIGEGKCSNQNAS